MKKDHIIFLIGRIHYKANKYLTGELKDHKVMGLAPSHGEILGSLMAKGPLPMTEIARIIDKDKSTITALVNKLIRMGYIEKRKHHADNRVSLIALTRKGESLKEDFHLIARKLRVTAYDGISGEEKETLVKLLGRIESNL
ncbi:MAG: MarR family transcriptional regulator [Syntrophales bacterium]|nr:MarR family transcriptional regulator [Syntrophales bacterium]